MSKFRRLLGGLAAIAALVAGGFLLTSSVTGHTSVASPNSLDVAAACFTCTLGDQ